VLSSSSSSSSSSANNLLIGLLFGYYDGLASPGLFLLPTDGFARNPPSSSSSSSSSPSFHRVFFFCIAGGYTGGGFTLGAIGRLLLRLGNGGGFMAIREGG
jgi:hypothetical protein